ncbi:MAG: aspartate carbamoyltransferase, partial [Verrucomicrobiota bacterium]
MASRDTWTKKDLTGIEELSPAEIGAIFRQADKFLPALAPGKGLDLMKGRTVVNLFLEPSTRTRTAFEISAKKLGAEVVSINTTASSLVKGETLRDTAMNIRAMGVDAIVMRHSSAGSARYLGGVLDISVV